MNFRKHARRALPAGIDAFSSGLDFDGWLASDRLRRVVAHAAERPPPLSGSSAVTPAHTWLARVGWRKHGAIRLVEQPQRPS